MYHNWKTGQWDWFLGKGDEPRFMKDPVYAGIRFQAAVGDRSFNMVTFAKAYDQDDCKRITEDMVSRMQQRQETTGVPVWQLVSSECKSSLDSRNAKLFDNKPSFVNYVSASQGDPSEREVRLIIWGVTAQEGELVCGLVPRVRERWKGPVSCIHALASE